MHELSLSSAILDTAIRHADGRRVEVVELSVGALRQVVPSSLEFYWDIVARGTVCEGSRLELNMIEALVSCNDCAAEWTLDDPIFACPTCKSTSVEVLTGTEFMVESIDISEKEEATF
jgi:hydrogenase nickel incorporation protein HypA/HybF